MPALTVGVVAIAPIVVFGAAEVAVIGGVLALVSNGMAVGGAAIIGFQVGDLAVAAAKKTGCFAK